MEEFKGSLRTVDHVALTISIPSSSADCAKSSATRSPDADPKALLQLKQMSTSGVAQPLRLRYFERPCTPE